MCGTVGLAPIIRIVRLSVPNELQGSFGLSVLKIAPFGFQMNQCIHGSSSHGYSSMRTVHTVSSWTMRTQAYGRGSSNLILSDDYVGH